MPTTHPVVGFIQLRVELEDIEPPIWRRLRVPASGSFWDLHVAIQDAMGWLDSHLHEFSLRGVSGGVVRIGSSFEDDECLPGWETAMGEYLAPGTELHYDYDFGDGWRHRITVEEVGLLRRSESLPVCLAGERACPPEDCGGPWGYVELLEALADPGHERHEELRDFYGGDLDPEAFDPSAVTFDDPGKRLAMARAGI